MASISERYGEFISNSKNYDFATYEYKDIYQFQIRYPGNPEIYGITGFGLPIDTKRSLLDVVELLQNDKDFKLFIEFIAQAQIINLVVNLYTGNNNTSQIMFRADCYYASDIMRQFTVNHDKIKFSAPIQSIFPFENYYLASTQIMLRDGRYRLFDGAPDPEKLNLLADYTCLGVYGFTNGAPVTIKGEQLDDDDRQEMMNLMMSEYNKSSITPLDHNIVSKLAPKVISLYHENMETLADYLIGLYHGPNPVGFNGSNIAVGIDHSIDSNGLFSYVASAKISNYAGFSIRQASPFVFECDRHLYDDELTDDLDEEIAERLDGFSLALLISHTYSTGYNIVLPVQGIIHDMWTEVEAGGESLVPYVAGEFRSILITIQMDGCDVHDAICPGFEYYRPYFPFHGAAQLTQSYNEFTIFKITVDEINDRRDYPEYQLPEYLIIGPLVKDRLVLQNQLTDMVQHIENEDYDDNYILLAVSASPNTETFVLIRIPQNPTTHEPKPVVERIADEIDEISSSDILKPEAKDTSFEEFPTIRLPKKKRSFFDFIMGHGDDE